MTADTQAARAEQGKARLRKEDARLVTGQTNWTDNIVLPGMLHMAFARSPMAHARITSVDLSAARALPGVIAAFSGADFADEQGSLPCAWPVTPECLIPAHPPMATEEVRYPGEAVAVVVARDRYTAADAAALVDVSYEPLPPVLDMRTALEEGSPKVHPEGNKSFEWVFAQGDTDEAFRERAQGQCGLQRGDSGAGDDDLERLAAVVHRRDRRTTHRLLHPGQLLIFLQRGPG